MSMGFSNQEAQTALSHVGFKLLFIATHVSQADGDVDVAVALLLDAPHAEKDIDKAAEAETRSLRQSNPDRESQLSVDSPSLLCKGPTNLFLGLMGYFRYAKTTELLFLIHLRSRLANYCRFCMICHKRHSCKSTKPVVCCDPVCIFRYTEILPSEKVARIRSVCV